MIIKRASRAAGYLAGASLTGPAARAVGRRAASVVRPAGPRGRPPPTRTRQHRPGERAWRAHSGRSEENWYRRSLAHAAAPQQNRAATPHHTGRSYYRKLLGEKILVTRGRQMAGDLGVHAYVVKRARRDRGDDIARVGTSGRRVTEIAALTGCNRSDNEPDQDD